MQSLSPKDAKITSFWRIAKNILRKISPRALRYVTAQLSRDSLACARGQKCDAKRKACGPIRTLTVQVAYIPIFARIYVTRATLSIRNSRFSSKNTAARRARLSGPETMHHNPARLALIVEKESRALARFLAGSAEQPERREQKRKRDFLLRLVEKSRLGNSPARCLRNTAAFLRKQQILQLPRLYRRASRARMAMSELFDPLLYTREIVPKIGVLCERCLPRESENLFFTQRRLYLIVCISRRRGRAL